MSEAAGRRARSMQAGSAMRPRRWYTDEIAPHNSYVKLTSRIWRYQSFIRGRQVDAALRVQAASIFWPRANQ